MILLVVIGKRKGFTSALGLIFTFICIIFLYLPMLYLGFSPFLVQLL
ncbi:MAG: YibE/F family protein [Thomasclavelia spiroformis]